MKNDDTDAKGDNFHFLSLRHRPGPETITVLMAFDVQSPIDGTISVQVGDGDPVEYRLVAIVQADAIFTDLTAVILR